MCGECKFAFQVSQSIAGFLQETAISIDCLIPFCTVFTLRQQAEVADRTNRKTKIAIITIQAFLHQIFGCQMLNIILRLISLVTCSEDRQIEQCEENLLCFLGRCNTLVLTLFCLCLVILLSHRITKFNPSNVLRVISSVKHYIVQALIAGALPSSMDNVQEIAFPRINLQFILIGVPIGIGRL